MTPSKSVAALLVALVVVLAGCTSATGVPGSPTADTSDTPTGSDGPDTADRPIVDVYVSDERNDVDDFAHLNVTVTRVGLHRTGANGSDGETGEWITRNVDSVTVDLTRLQGAKATRIASFDLPNGTYTKVFVYVSNVDGTLNNGESTRVKLPSGKLHLNEGFTVGNGESIDFVFDISVHRAGNSGKYVLKPVISESGTDVPIDDVGDDRDVDDEGDDADHDLEVEFAEEPTRNGSVTLVVTLDGDPAKNAQVFVQGDRVGKTDADGRLSIDLPDAETVTLTVRANGERETIELDLGT